MWFKIVFVPYIPIVVAWILLAVITSIGFASVVIGTALVILAAEFLLFEVMQHYIE